MINRPTVVVAVSVLVLAAGGAWYLHGRNVTPPPETAAKTLPADTESAIDHPLPDSADASGTSVLLPDLADSDAPVLDALAKISSPGTVKDFLVPENVIRRIVVTIDNLPRQKDAVDKRPTTAVPGSFAADGDELHATLDRSNFARYKPLVAAIGQMDMQRLAAVYIRFYPLFQQSYQNLGYPNGYFNDRLVQVIDVMLAAPEPKGPIELVRPNVMYTFADPALEARPAGQKLLIRMGPENAAIIKAKLAELKAAVAAAPPKH